MKTINLDVYNPKQLWHMITVTHSGFFKIQFKTNWSSLSSLNYGYLTMNDVTEITMG